jgi:hypothetical protein
MYQFSRGLGVSSYYEEFKGCIVNTTVIIKRYGNSFQGGDGWWNGWLELALTIGNTSTWYKGCYTNSEASFYDAYYFIKDYKTFLNYAMNFMANLLAQAFSINGYIVKMKDLVAKGNSTGLFFYYGLIIKNVFFFKVPEAGALQSSYPPELQLKEDVLLKFMEKFGR